jgi:hypothetical protein
VPSPDPFDEQLPTIGEQEAAALLESSRPYTLVVLREGPNRGIDGADALVRQHGIRNMRLRKAGWLRVVCRVRDDSAVAGIGIFDLDLERTRAVLDADPAVQAGLFVVDLHPVVGFPGDSLAGLP